MKSSVYSKVREFKNKYPLTIAWRLKAHCKVIEKHLNEGEQVLYAFAAQRNTKQGEIFTTYVVALTNKRIMLGQKRVFFGYFFTSITPDLFNDLKVKMGIIWGKVFIDTVKEKVILSNIPKAALPEIETTIIKYMMEEKKKYFQQKSEKNI
jgi:hypothetical protein